MGRPTGAAYEQLVAKMLSEYLQQKVDCNVRMPGRRQPGVYEIDIAARIEYPPALSFLLIVECKNWSKPVGREQVQKLLQTRDAVSADKAAMVSPIGFTKEALEVAEAHHVALWVIAESRWDILLAAGRDPSSLAEDFNASRLALLHALGVNANEKHAEQRTLIAYSELRDGSGELQEWAERGSYECTLAPWTAEYAHVVGIDERTAFFELINDIFSKMTTDLSGKSVRPPRVAEWIDKTALKLVEVGSPPVEASRLALAIGRGDYSTYERIRRSLTK